MMARKLLDDSSSESEHSSDAEGGLKINNEYARKFEHNKMREELQQLEEKYGKGSKKRKRGSEEDEASESDQESSSSSENEDDSGELATAALDSEIMATLEAIRSRDPKVYDGKTSFYSAMTEESQPMKESDSKPMFLRDYHRQNLLNGVSAEDDTPPLTYDQERQQIKDNLVANINGIAEDSEDGDDLLVVKKRQPRIVPAVTVDVENAERDPETFLSNFMAARAWVPTEKTIWQPLESDDEEEERKADAFEEAYNMRFEDPHKSNETLRSHARDLAAKYSVRREDKNARKRKRELEKEQKELEKRHRKEEKARLRKLRIAEVEDKLRKIKTAAGLEASDLRPEDWSRFVDEEWDDKKWEEEMQQRFGETYYAKQDVASDREDESSGRRHKPKKPKFQDDIDINDIVPDFQEDEQGFSLSDEEDRPSKKKNHKRLKEDKKREAKKERRIIEHLVDNQLELDLKNDLSQRTNGFRYRETSPQSFGLDARDILLADDSLLNQFAGLKKLATFRDPIKKQKDRKHLGKKARLREWRKEAFGNEEGLRNSDLVPSKNDQGDDGEVKAGIDVKVTSKKRRRPKKKKPDTQDISNIA